MEEKMSKLNKSLILKVFPVVFALSVFQMNGFSRFILNGSPESFTEQAQPEIEGYVMEGAGYFLKSQSETLLLLNKIELSDLNGVDYAELQQLVESALANMVNAKAKYSALTQIADTTAYEQSVIDLLKTFDYYSFQQTYGLNSVIFNQTAAYLETGDVRGLYDKILSDTQTIIDRLSFVKSVIDAETLPDTSYLWRLNQSFSDTLFVGQYAAEVFYDITGKK
jgi:hypothetical protein